MGLLSLSELCVLAAAPCVDHNEKCPGWAATGECKINAKWMSENCAVSCKRCVPPSRVVSDKGEGEQAGGLMQGCRYR